MIRPNQLFHETIRLKVARNELASPLEGSYLLGRGPDLDIFAPQPAPDIYAPQPTPVDQLYESVKRQSRYAAAGVILSGLALAGGIVAAATILPVAGTVIGLTATATLGATASGLVKDLGLQRDLEYFFEYVDAKSIRQQPNEERDLSYLVAGAQDASHEALPNDVYLLVK